MRVNLFTALIITIHNFPEGLATFGATLTNMKLGIVIAIAVDIHNILEGISISVPIFNVTKNKNKAFIYAFLSGIAEPIGAIIRLLFLQPFLTAEVLSYLLIHLQQGLWYIYRYMNSSRWRIVMVTVI